MIAETAQTEDPDSVNPHVQLSMRVETDKKEFLLNLKNECLVPLGFETKNTLMVDKYVDPFLVLSCYSFNKPSIEKPSRALQADYVPWSRLYSAKSFAVNVGQK